MLSCGALVAVVGVPDGELASLVDDAVRSTVAAFERCGTVDSGKLGSAHAALDGQYSYGVLKCLLAEVG